MDKQSALQSRQTDTVSAVAGSAGRSSQKGASAIEYVMIIAVIVLAVVIAFNTTNLGPWITETFEELTGELDAGGGG